MALAAASPSEARGGRNAAAAIGFGAGAVVGAAAANSAYGDGYYGPGYGYADEGYAAGPGYDGYAYEAPVGRAYGQDRNSSEYRCTLSPASQNFGECDY
jgi:hypothetical protein